MKFPRCAAVAYHPVMDAFAEVLEPADQFDMPGYVRIRLIFLGEYDEERWIAWFRDLQPLTPLARDLLRTVEERP